MLTLEPKLKVLKGIATIKAGQNAEGARVLLVSGNERRPIPALPIKIDITTNKSYTLVAQRTGYSEFRQDITFEDGNAEKTFVIDMTQAGESAPEPSDPHRRPRHARSSAARPRARRRPRARCRFRAPGAAERSRRRRNRPGHAQHQLDPGLERDPRRQAARRHPKVGLKVSAGPHTVVFVHPEHGRKVRGVTVRPNETATAAVRFP